jgi:glycine betaine/choline ABC-type transport system substrate-binding protein
VRSLCLLIAAALSCACSRPRPIIVGSKNYTEQIVVGEVVAQHLERRLGAPVQRRLNLGGTLLVHQALLARQVDVYPEYSGTALTNIFRRAPEYDADAAYERARQEFERQRVVLFPRLGFASGVAVCVLAGDADAVGLETLTDAAAYRAGWKIAADHDFVQRPNGYALLMKTYALPMRLGPQILDRAAMLRALAAGHVNMLAVTDTEALPAAAPVKRLRDDKGAFPPNEAGLVARAETLESYPDLREALAELSGKFPHATVAELGREVDRNHRPVAEVAAGFLKQTGLAR